MLCPSASHRQTVAWLDDLPLSHIALKPQTHLGDCCTGGGGKMILGWHSQEVFRIIADNSLHRHDHMSNIGGEPALVVPALASALKDSDIRIRWNTLTALSLGSQGPPAVPRDSENAKRPGHRRVQP